MSSDLHRRSIRLKCYDYSTAGVYFVTICVQDRACLLGDLVEQQMRLNDAGQMVREVWDDLSGHYPGVSTDAVVVMPNHLHGIIALKDSGGLSLADVVHRFKTMTTMRYTRGVKDLGWPGFRGRFWQRSGHRPRG